MSRPSRMLIYRLLLAWFVGHTSLASPCFAQDVVPETELPFIKAAVIYSLCKFVEWPGEEAGAADTLLIGVVGDTLAAPAFSTISGKVLGSRHIDVAANPPADKVGSCDVVFVQSATPEDLASLWAALAGRPVLTVSELDAFCERGGTVQLFEREGRLGLRVNLDVADRAGLRVSSQLLKVAEVIREQDWRVD